MKILSEIMPAASIRFADHEQEKEDLNITRSHKPGISSNLACGPEEWYSCKVYRTLKMLPGSYGAALNI